MKRIIISFLLLLAIGFYFSSCAKGISPYDAANGKARCGKYIK